ncbi:MAG: glycosyltransferase [Magnetococcales bacterium]|nr:glycosyltransferase [Magnetococcales bacterium]
MSYRILHTEASLGLGGQEIRILTELAGLIGRNHQATLVCPPSSRIRDEALRMGLPATALPIGRKNLAGLRSMSAWLRHHPVDVVISHSSTDSWLTALATRFLLRAKTRQTLSEKVSGRVYEPGEYLRSGKRNAEGDHAAHTPCTQGKGTPEAPGEDAPLLAICGAHDAPSESPCQRALVRMTWSSHNNPTPFFSTLARKAWI